MADQFLHLAVFAEFRLTIGADPLLRAIRRCNPGLKTPCGPGSDGFCQKAFYTVPVMFKNMFKEDFGAPPILQLRIAKDVVMAQIAQDGPGFDIEFPQPDIHCGEQQIELILIFGERWILSHWN